MYSYISSIFELINIFFVGIIRLTYPQTSKNVDLGRHDRHVRSLEYLTKYFEHKRKICPSYLIVVAQISALRGLIVPIGTVSRQKLSALASQGVDATLQVYVESRAVVDGEGALRRDVRVARVNLVRQTLAVQSQKGREVYDGLGYFRLRQKRTVYAIFGSALKNIFLKLKKKLF